MRFSQRMPKTGCCLQRQAAASDGIASRERKVKKMPVDVWKKIDQMTYSTKDGLKADWGEHIFGDHDGKGVAASLCTRFLKTTSKAQANKTIVLT